jgi:large subunit ribosomal protein L10
VRRAPGRSSSSVPNCRDDIWEGGSWQTPRRRPRSKTWPASSGNATFNVTKNTLAKVAATQAGVGDQVESMLSGPSAIAFVSGDVAQAAKGLLDFAKANPLLVIKGGVLDGKALTPAEVGKLADLEPREVLLAKLAGAMKASMAGAAATFNALPTQMALLADALRAKVEASTPQADEAPATTDTAAPADVTEAPEVAEPAATETQD